MEKPQHYKEKLSAAWKNSSTVRNTAASMQEEKLCIYCLFDCIVLHGKTAALPRKTVVLHGKIAALQGKAGVLVLQEKTLVLHG